jgi:polysaccharide biosynthesis/export protein
LDQLSGRGTTGLRSLVVAKSDLACVSPGWREAVDRFPNLAVQFRFRIWNFTPLDCTGLAIQDADNASSLPKEMIKPSPASNFVPQSTITVGRKCSPQGSGWRFIPHLKLLLAGVVLFACASCETTISTKLPEGDVVRGPVTLTPGDVVKLTFPGAPELNQSQKIQSDGKINLPMVGEVDAGGRTLADLQQRLEVLYKPQLQNTTVVVTLESSVTPVLIGGAVTKPGKYLFDRPTTVLQAVMEAGGADKFGTLGRVSVIRLVNGQQRTEIFDLRPILQGSSVKPVYVRAGDIVLIGESKF